MSIRALVRRLRDDRGASALLIAGAMVLIMGLAAVVIDGGFGFSERRQAQSGVDFAALGALREAVSCEAGGCTLGESVDNGANEAIAIVAANLPGRALDWSMCDDPSQPSSEYIHEASFTECVSFTDNLDKARVHLPDDNIDTAFGGLIGLDSLTVMAEAEAGSRIESSTKVIPHTPTATSGAEACLFSNPTPRSVPPCDGSTSGFFGYLDAALYGDDSLGTPSTCNNGDSNTRVAINLAKGGDHSLIEYKLSPPDPVVNDHSACPNSNEDINEVVVQTGTPDGGVTDGLISGVSGSINGESFTSSPGRIVCDLHDPVNNPEGTSTECASVRGINLDHTGLWEFLDSGCSGTDTHAAMDTCLQSGSPTFLSSLAEHPRFAAVPILHPRPSETEAPTGPGPYKIESFQAVWLETVYFDCTASKCDTIHSPGQDYTPPGPAPGDPGPCPATLDTTRNCGWTDTSGSDTVEGLLAFLIDQSMLPPSITDTFPGSETERSYALSE